MKSGLLVLAMGLLASASIQAADIFYKNSGALYVIHDADKGKTESRKLDNFEGTYMADGGAVIFLENTNLRLIQNTREPKTIKIDGAVSDYKMKDGLIAYVKGNSLYVRRVSDDASKSSRSVIGSTGAFQVDVAGGCVVFMKGTTLYRVSDVDAGKTEQVAFTVGDIKVVAP